MQVLPGFFRTSLGARLKLLKVVIHFVQFSAQLFAERIYLLGHVDLLSFSRVVWGKGLVLGVLEFGSVFERVPGRSR